jgi:glycine cleavage system aminomethyltransferase T
MAHLESRYAPLGTPVHMEVTVEHRRKEAKARVVKLPFLDLERKRA